MGKILSLLLLVLCIEPTALSEVTVHQEFYPYYKEYTDTLRSVCPKYVTPKNIDVRFVTRPKDATWVGLCSKWSGNKDFLVQISADFWFFPEFTRYRRVLLFHEFSHCFLSVPHSMDNSNYMYKQVIPISDVILSIQYMQDIKAMCDTLGN